MKTIQLFIDATNIASTTNYYIYRATDAHLIPPNLVTLDALTPSITIQGSKAVPIAQPIYENLNVSLTDIPVGGKTPYKFLVVPLKDNIHDISIFVTTNATSTIPEQSVTFKINFNADGSIYSLNYTNTANIVNTYYSLSDINNYVVLTGNSIFIANTYLTNLSYVASSYYYKAICVQDPIELPADTIPATGLCPPFLDYTSVSSNLANETDLKIITLKPIDKGNGVTYYYRIVALDSVLGISDPSKLVGICLTPNNEDIEFEIYSSENYVATSPSSATWLKIADSIKLNSSIALDDIMSSDYSLYGEACTNLVPIFPSTAVILDKHNIINNKLGLTIPNVWQNNDMDYNNRSYKAFKTRAYLVSTTSNTYSDYSEVLTIPDTLYVPIEKIVVIKKDITNDLTDTGCIDISRLDYTEVMTYIKRGGIYYNDVTYHSFPVDLQDAIDTTGIITVLSSFKTLNFIDNGVIKGNTYNYTIYTYDCFQKCSSTNIIVGL